MAMVEECSHTKIGTQVSLLGQRFDQHSCCFHNSLCSKADLIQHYSEKAASLLHRAGRQTRNRSSRHGWLVTKTD